LDVFLTSYAHQSGEGCAKFMVASIIWRPKIGRKNRTQANGSKQTAISKQKKRYRFDPKR